MAMNSAGKYGSPSFLQDVIRLILSWTGQSPSTSRRSELALSVCIMDVTWTAKQLIWVGDDSGLPDKDDNTTMVGSMVSVGNQDTAINPIVPRCFQNDVQKYIQAQAGHGWVFVGTQHKEIHQSIVIASEMGRLANLAVPAADYTNLTIKELKALFVNRNMSHRGAKLKQHYIDMLVTADETAIGYWTWSRLMQCLDGSSGDELRDETLIVFAWSGIPDMPRIHAVYEKLASLADEGIKIRCYPEFGDLHEAERKLGDIEVLDFIARDTDFEAHKYRPETCFRSQDCTLTAPCVMKRTHSAGGEHVELVPDVDRANGLRCRGVSGRATRSSPQASGRDEQLLVKLSINPRSLAYLETSTPIWFHQEKISSLIEYGEFRIIVVSLPDPQGLRGLSGAVFEAFHTKPREGLPTEPTVNVMSRVSNELLSPEHCGTKTYKDLEDFALFVYARLREYGQRARGPGTASSQHPDSGRSNGTGNGKRRRSTIEHVEGPPSKVQRVAQPSAGGSGGVPAINASSIQHTNIRDSGATVEDAETPPSALAGHLTSTTEEVDNGLTTAINANTAQITIAEVGDGNTVPFVLAATAMGPIEVVEDPHYRQTMFDSLEVAVRLDIGISSAEDGHRFFVNEITREWYGDLISYRTGEPRTRICTAIANARARYLFGMGKVVAEDDNARSEVGNDDELRRHRSEERSRQHSDDGTGRL